MRFVTGLLLAAICFGETGKGLRPRPSQDDYAATASQPELTIAAASLSTEEVKNAFATGLIPHYIVIEIAVYPGKSNSMELRQDDFVLRMGPHRTLIRPVDARTIAARLHRKTTADRRTASSPSDITLYPSVGVGVGSGRGYPGRGAGTSVGVGVGIGSAGSVDPPPPASTDADRKTMESELSDKGLPEGKFTEPVGGYIYFPATSSGKRKATAALELEYLGGQSRATLRLPAVR